MNGMSEAVRKCKNLLRRYVKAALDRGLVWNESEIRLCGVLPLWKWKRSTDGRVRKFCLFGLPVFKIKQEF